MKILPEYALLRAMATAVPERSDDIEALQAMLAAATERARRSEAANAELAAENTQLKQVNETAEERIARLYAMIKMLERAQYGKRSERLDEDQYRLALEEIETGLGAVRAEVDKLRPKPEATRRARKTLPLHLERVEVVIEPEDAPGCEGFAKILIGEDVSERLDVTPAKFRVIVTRRPKYTYKGHDGVIQAPAPARIIEAGIPTEALLAQIAVSKYADGLPLYRQQAIYARDKVELSRSVMASWMGRVGFELEPLADHVLKRILVAERLFADETSLPTLAPGSGKTKTAWLWTYARDDRPFGGDDPPMVAYRFEDSRGGECVARHLAGYAGIVQVDGYAAYNRLAEPARPGGPATLAACWAHVRRKFFELHTAGLSDTATRTVERMASLWEVENRIRGQAPDERRSARQAQSTPIVAELFNLWQAELARIPGKSRLAEAIRYATGRRPLLERFLDDGRIEIDSNTVERAIRPQTITRKNALFAGSDGGGKAWATIATLLATAKLNNADPYRWLTVTLERIAAGWLNSDLETLMPWNCPN